MTKPVVLRNQFVNQNTPSSNSGGSIRKFIMDYMLRPSAVEPVVTDLDRNRQVLDRLSQLKAPKDSHALSYLNRQLKYDGVGFNLDSVAMSRQEMKAMASDAQRAYDRGATIKQTVISFDTQWLKDHGVLSPEVTLPVKRGDLRGQLDSVRLRHAVTDGVKAMIDESTMKAPQMAAAIQTDTAHVHVHLCIWDQDETVKDDRGKISASQRETCINAIESSIEQSLPSLNNTRGLQNLARMTQRNAQFKLKVLGQQLQNSALSLDQVSLDEYINSLTQFDGRTISRKQRDNLRQQIQLDWQLQGRPSRQNRTLSPGQRRMRRQLWAQRHAEVLRQARQAYNQQAANGQVSSSAQAVKDALDFEFQRQQMIVEKYRTYARPTAAVIYQRHAESLKNRRQVLLNRRQQVLKSLGGYYLRPFYVNRLLSNPRVMQGLSELAGDRPVTQSSGYRELRAAEDDGYTPLSNRTIRAATKYLNQDDTDQVLAILQLNQQTPMSDQLSARSRRELYQYLEDLDEYEADAASLGGISTDRWSVGFHLGERLPEPSVTASIYDRNFEQHEVQSPDLLAVDAHHVLDSGPLKSEIVQAMNRQLIRRRRVLLRADNYFMGTHQDRPQWLTDAMQDLVRQTKMFAKSTGQDYEFKMPQERQVEHVGYELNESTTQQLVQKHLREVDALTV